MQLTVGPRLEFLTALERIERSPSGESGELRRVAIRLAIEYGRRGKSAVYLINCAVADIHSGRRSTPEPGHANPAQSKGGAICFDSRNPASSAATQSIRGWTRFVLILFAASACSAWGPHAVETSTPQTGRLQGHFRVTVRDGSTLRMKNIHISGDSIAGLRDTRPYEPVAVPRSQVIAFERRSFSARETSYLLIASIVGFCVAVVVAFSQADL